MRIQQLRLENFRQYVNSEVIFGDGMIAIVGPNGAGKTTLFEAIGFALFNENRDKKENIRHLWASTKAKYAVTLWFELGGSKYVIFRSETKTDFKQITPEGDIVLATGAVPVTNRVTNLLGMNYAQFKNSFCAEQKDLSFLSFDAKANVHDEISRMLGFDRIKRAEELGKGKRKAIKETLEALQAMLGDKKILEDEVASAKSQVAQHLSNLSLLQSQKSEAEASLPSMEEAFLRATAYEKAAAEMQMLGGKAEALKAQVATAELRVTQTTERAARRQELEPKEIEFKAISEKLSTLEHLRAADEARAKIEVELALGLKRSKDLRVQLSQIPEVGIDPLIEREQSLLASQVDFEKRIVDATERWRVARQDSESKVVQAKTKLQQLELILSKAESLVAKGICPECNQKLSGDFEAGLNLRRSEVEDAKLRVAEALPAQKAAEAEPAELASARTDLTSVKASLSSLGTEIANVKAKIADRDKVIKELHLQDSANQALESKLANTPKQFDAELYSSLSEKLKNLKAEHETFLGLAAAASDLAEATSALEAAVQARNDARGAYQTAKAIRDEQGFDSPEQVKQALSAAVLAREKVKGIIANITSIETGLKLAQSLLDSRQSRLTEFQTRQTEIAKLQFDLLHLDTVVRQMRALGQDLNRRILPELEARASQNVDLLTNGRYMKISLDPATFKPSLVDEEDLSKKVISGGEEDVVALSLRLALSEMIQERQGHPFALLILDEVFGSLDEERRHSVLSRLLSLKGRFRQIFVISHIEGIHEVADQCIILRRDPVTRATVLSEDQFELAQTSLML